GKRLPRATAAAPRRDPRGSRCESSNRASSDEYQHRRTKRVTPASPDQAACGGHAERRMLWHMSDYTIKNMMDVEDAAAERGPGLQARFARQHLDSQHLGVSYFNYEPGVRSPFGHSHREQ